jgi:hypothetical protein
VLVAVAAVALCGACGGGVSGRYVGKGETFLDSITFVSDERVQVVFIGQTREDTYVLDGSTVTITAPNGQRSAFTVGSDGCLTNQLLGTYCKDGAAAPAPAEASSPARGGAEVFEATAREGRIRLEFGVARKAQITMMPENLADAPERMSFDVSYEVSGDDITVNLPGNESLRLTRSGEDLEGTMNGETVRFVRR